MALNGIETWIARLRAVVDETVLRDIEPSSFVDERGTRRAVDGPLIAWLSGGSVMPIQDGGLDVWLWGALAAGEGAAGDLFCADGPLQDADAPGRGDVAIEVWTERELSAIQALWTLGVERAEPALRERAEAAARWCVEEMQPDNATAHPWGVNAFAALSATGDIEAELYAQTLVHNAQVGTGRLGRFANLVLVGSLRSLESARA